MRKRCLPLDSLYFVLLNLMGKGERFNGIREIIGLDPITTSWARHLSNSLEEWQTNLTSGLGPTRN